MCVQVTQQPALSEPISESERMRKDEVGEWEQLHDEHMTKRARSKNEASTAATAQRRTPKKRR